MHWAAKYIGLPWQEKDDVDSPAGLSCWGLVRKVLLDQRGIVIPGVDVSPKDIRDVLRAFKDHEEFGSWNEVPPDELQDCDALLMSQSKNPVHVGLWVPTPEGGGVLHSAANVGVIFQDLITLNTHGYQVLKCYRHDSLCS